MNFRVFFSQNTFWGKLLGGFFGYLIAGPSGALFGILIGNFFDKGLAQHFNRPYWEVYSQRHSELQRQFLETTFLVLGYLAKNGGRVTEQAIQYATQLMHDLRLNTSQCEEARNAFRRGKLHAFDLAQTLSELKNNLRLHPDLMMTFLNILYQSAQTEGLSPQKIKAVNHIFQILGYAPIERQFRFYHDYDTSSYQQRNDHDSSAPPSVQPLLAAYALLGVDPQSTQATVKKAYRRLMGQHHPDKLMSQGKTETELKRANEKTQQISKAYEVICKQRGWN